MAEDISAQRIHEYKEAFRHTDEDKDGKLSYPEVRDVMMRLLGLAVSDSEIRDMMRPMGTQERGGVLFNEFVTMMERKRQEPDDRQLIESFRMFDKDGDGRISAAELKYVFGTFGERLTDADVDNIIKEADADGDGYINYEEFVNLIKSLY